MPCSPRALSLEVAAQEVYRVVLFLVLYLEVWLIGRLPYVGKGLSIMASCWMTSFFCFDYRWALQGTPLLDRLAFFECAAPFFGGFGLLLAVVTAVMPFYSGAAVIAILFPLFVLVACGCEPSACITASSSAQSGSGLDSRGGGTAPMHGAQQSLGLDGLWRFPVFSLALKPTNAIMSKLASLTAKKH